MKHCWLVVFSRFFPALVSGQVIETVGGRALGMGGAFVAVADDSTASWWNPAGLAAGPFVDLSLGWASADTPTDEPAGRRSAWVRLGTPPFGVSYYQMRQTRRSEATAGPDPGRQEGRGGLSAPFRVVRQFGATVVQTIVDGVHVGTTLKYVRGEELDAERRGSPGGAFDLDVGLLAVRGPVRVGGAIRNVGRANAGDLRSGRHLRAGAAFDASEAGGMPLLVALDADLTAYKTWHGDRRVVAVGAEARSNRRVAVRGGARFNLAGRERSRLAAGTTVAIRAGVHPDGHAVIGDAGAERGWGVSPRASF